VKASFILAGNALFQKKCMPKNPYNAGFGRKRPAELKKQAPCRTMALC
jgi:hypothetical protein